MGEIKFIKGTFNNINSLESYDSDSIYFSTDKPNVGLGNSTDAKVDWIIKDSTSKIYKITKEFEHNPIDFDTSYMLSEYGWNFDKNNLPKVGDRFIVYSDCNNNGYEVVFARKTERCHSSSEIDYYLILRYISSKDKYIHIHYIDMYDPDMQHTYDIFSKGIRIIYGYDLIPIKIPLEEHSYFYGSDDNSDGTDPEQSISKKFWIDHTTASMCSALIFYESAGKYKIYQHIGNYSQINYGSSSLNHAYDIFQTIDESGNIVKYKITWQTGGLGYDYGKIEIVPQIKPSDLEWIEY